MRRANMIQFMRRRNITLFTNEHTRLRMTESTGSPAQVTHLANWYHLGGQRFVMFVGCIYYVSKARKKHDGILWGVAIIIWKHFST